MRADGVVHGSYLPAPRRPLMRYDDHAKTGCGSSPFSSQEKPPKGSGRLLQSTLKGPAVLQWLLYCYLSNGPAASTFRRECTEFARHRSSSDHNAFVAAMDHAPTPYLRPMLYNVSPQRTV